MKTRKDGAVLRQLSTLFNVGATRELTDGQLLERFSTGGGEVAELAFEALVERHGAMVLRVCRARLVDPHDTQDAFQATFLILVQKARTLWVRDSLGPWLHQVAVRTASCARAAASRRRRHERRVAEMGASCEEQQDAIGSEIEKVLHEEINRLPECYRVPIVLCDLQGYTCEEAARWMGRPVGTVKSWRFRGRERLRHRLTRLGLAPSAGLGAALAVDVARAAAAKPNAEEAVRIAMRALSDWMTVGEVPASVHTLVKGVLKTMLLGKLRTAATGVLALAFLSAGFAAAAWVVADDPHTVIDEAKTESPRPSLVEQSRRMTLGLKESDEVWSLTLRQAIGIGLDNSKEIRLISNAGNGTPFKISPRTAGVDAERFKSEAMAEVRSIEQQYWNLVQQHIALGAADRATAMAEAIVKKEQAALNNGRGTIADVAEASQRFEMFKFDLITRSSDVMTTDRQLRNLLGLPPADGRRIVPVTAPTEARLEPDWNECLAAMLEHKPDLVQSKAIVKAAESDMSADGVARLAGIRACHQQLIHQATHSLARSCLEIDANYKQFESASRLRVAAAKRLDAQRAYYDEGKIPVDRFLDSVSQYATAVAQEAQYRATYNIAMVGLEEAKGTLLEQDQITIVEGPRAVVPAAAGPVGATKPAFYERPVIGPPPALASGPFPPAAPDAITPTRPTLGANELQAKDGKPKADPGGKAFSFQVTVNIGSQPVEISGSFAITPVRSRE